MKWFLGCLLLLALQPVGAALPHLELDVTLDPQTRTFRAKAELTATEPLPKLALNPVFKVSRSRLAGTGAPAARPGARTGPDGAQPARPQRLEVEYSGTLPPLPAGDPRDPGAQAGLFASPEGSYLAPGARWYPDPGAPFTYRLRLSLPAGQSGLAPGTQRRAGLSGSRYLAEYEFDQAAEGVWLIAGPYRVAQQSLTLADGRSVSVRTWFHAELAGLSAGYLEDSMRYLQRYSRLIGSYPFGDFSIVSSPLPTGLGIPSLTYLGREVLRLPFIRATSLGHEVLHNWWGNGVYPQWTSGNWSEGLTTFMADYAFKEEQSDAAAREMRLGWLRDLAAVPAAQETALADFRSRQHGISSVIGYGKSAMLFFMLRDEIGAAAFNQGIRLLWEGHRFGSAGWSELEAAFARASGRDLSAFFAQWVRRPVSAQLELAARRDSDPAGSFRLIQHGSVFNLLVPLQVGTVAGERHDIAVRVQERQTVVDPAQLPAGAAQVALDPQLRLWRRLDASTVPPIFRELFVAPQAQLLLANKGPEWRGPGAALAARLLENPPVELAEPDLLAPQLPALVIGDASSISRLLPALGLPGLPEVLLAANPPDPAARLKGTAQAWITRAGNGKTFGFVMTGSASRLDALQRALPHYGRQSWLVFQEGRVSEQGAWPVPAQSLALNPR